METTEPVTVPGALTRIGQSLVSALPPAFLILLVLNLCFIGFVMWFLDEQLAQRDHMAKELFDRCMEIALPHGP